jgi:hypothetical protein
MVMAVAVFDEMTRVCPAAVTKRPFKSSTVHVCAPSVSVPKVDPEPAELAVAVPVGVPVASVLLVNAEKPSMSKPPVVCCKPGSHVKPAT